MIHSWLIHWMGIVDKLRYTITLVLLIELKQRSKTAIFHHLTEYSLISWPYIVLSASPVCIVVIWHTQGFWFGKYIYCRVYVKKTFPDSFCLCYFCFDLDRPTRQQRVQLTDTLFLWVVCHYQRQSIEQKPRINLILDCTIWRECWRLWHCNVNSDNNYSISAFLAHPK